MSKVKLFSNIIKSQTVPRPRPRPRFGGGSVGGFIKLFEDWLITTNVKLDWGGGGGGGPIVELVDEIGGWGAIF